MSYLFLALHYPKPEYESDLLAAMRRFDEALRRAPGLQRIGTWREPESGRIVGLALWDSQEAFESALQANAAVLDEIQSDVWEERPREVIRGEEIRFSAQPPPYTVQGS